MNAGANKDDAKEKRNTFSWDDETILFALREIFRAGAHLPKNLTLKRLTAVLNSLEKTWGISSRNGLQAGGRNGWILDTINQGCTERGKQT